MVTIEFFLQVVSDSMRYKIAVCDDPDADRSYILNMVHAGLRVQVIRFFTVQKLSHFLWPPLFFSEYKYIFFSVSLQATGDKKQLLLLFFHEQRFLRLSHKFPSFYSISDYLSVKKLPSLRSEIFLKKIKKEQPTSCSFFI